jgi:hypothetical protein
MAFLLADVDHNAVNAALFQTELISRPEIATVPLQPVIRQIGRVGGQSAGKKAGPTTRTDRSLASIDWCWAAPEASVAGAGTAATLPRSGFADGSGMMALLMSAGVTVLARNSATRW